MPKPLPLTDFRAVRIVLKRGDFAYAPGPEPPPSDPVEKDIWIGIMTLPDDVAIRTSNHYGSILQGMDRCWDAWIGSIGEHRDPVYDAILDASDEFQAATFNSLHGYYRQAFGCLRNALEVMAIATFCQVLKRRKLSWRREVGKIRIGFGEACDGLVGTPRLAGLRTKLKKELNDSIFDPMIRNVNHGGWARRLYSDLSEYEHSRPKFRNVDMWQSNGPVFSPRAFTAVAASFYETSAICFLLVKMARPKFVLPAKAQEIWTSTAIRPSRIAIVVHDWMF
jgi:hypothetical protein